jgi:peptidoglycan/LPS O-acetylase OafA/YrhL
LTRQPSNADRNLDVLRALAVLAVLVFHSLVPFGAPNSLPGLGHFGVLIFFVHTARVLMASMERGQGAGWVRRFYVQRFFRIYPLAVACVAAALVFRIPGSTTRLFVTPPAAVIVANFALVQNFWTHLNSIVAPMWSLPFEVQMYVLLPLIFVTVRKGGRKAAWALVAASFVVALADLYVPHAGPGLLRFFPCFMAGVLAYTTNATPLLWWWTWPGAIAALYFVFAGLGAGADWIICLALGMMLPFFREAPEGVLSRAAHLVARYSYGIYLSHMPLLWLCFRRLHAGRAAQIAIFLSLIVIVPVALYHLLEYPLIRFGRGPVKAPRATTARAPGH